MTDPFRPGTHDRRRSVEQRGGVPASLELFDEPPIRPWKRVVVERIDAYPAEGLFQPGGGRAGDDPATIGVHRDLEV